MKIKKEPLFNIPLDEITVEWLNSKMTEHNLQQRDLCSAVCITESRLSDILLNKTNFPKDKKAAFFWFFKFLETQKNA